MTSPSTIYIQAEAKGRLLFQRLQQRLSEPQASDVVRAYLEINYDTKARDDILDYSDEIGDALSNENIEAEG